LRHEPGPLGLVNRSLIHQSWTSRQRDGPCRHAEQALRNGVQASRQAAERAGFEPQAFRLVSQLVYRTQALKWAAMVAEQRAWGANARPNRRASGAAEADTIIPITKRGQR
jgi:hypothetical protein